MSCKFKHFLPKCTKPNCKAIWGECQFTIDNLDSVCPIRAAYHGEMDLLTYDNITVLRESPPGICFAETIGLQMP